MQGNLINGRTPEYIKTSLAAHGSSCAERCADCEYGNAPRLDCSEGLCIDALAYIERLEAERDAAIKDIPRACGYCKHYNDPPKIEDTKHGMKVSYCEKECRHISGVNTGWEWRGLKPPEVDA